MSRVTVPPILATLIGRIAVAVPGRARATFTELLLGAAVTRGGHVTDAILAVGLSRGWTTYYWLLERGRWSWLPVWQALLGVLKELFAPPVWHVVVVDTVVERISARAPGSLVHHNHAAKPNRSRFLRGQGWLVPGRGRRARVAGRGGAADAAPGPARHQSRQAHEWALPAAPARRPARPGTGPARRLVHARPADRARGRRRSYRDRPGTPGPGALRGPPSASAPPPGTAAQVRPTDDAAEDRSAAAPAQRTDPVRQARGRAVPDLPGRGPLPQGPGGARRMGAAGAARPARQAERGATAGLHRPRPACDRGHHQLRQAVERRAAVRGHEARLGAQGRLAAVAPGADALGDDPGRGLRAQPDAGLHRPGPHSGPRRSGAVAAARDAHGRADPGGPGAAFARGRPACPHACDLAKSLIPLAPADQHLVGGGLESSGEAEQALERGGWCTPSIEAEDELVEVGLQVLLAQAVIDAQAPALGVGEHAVDPGQHEMGGHRSDHLGVVLDVLERGVTGPAVTDHGAATGDRRRDEAAQALG